MIFYIAGGKSESSNVKTDMDTSNDCRTGIYTSTNNDRLRILNFYIQYRWSAF